MPEIGKYGFSDQKFSIELFSTKLVKLYLTGHR
jgi:hypothetical protein